MATIAQRRQPSRTIWYVFAAVAILVVLAAVVMLSNQPTAQGSQHIEAWLTLNTYCRAHVYTQDGDKCEAWARQVLGGSSNYSAILACDDSGAFVSCLARAGVSIPK